MIYLKIKFEKWESRLLIWDDIKHKIMRKNSGIVRNKTNFFLEARSRRDKKKNRFQNINKMD